MCALCEAAGFGADFTLTSRPAQKLGGLRWSGPPAAAADDLRGVLDRVRAFSASRAALWKSPIVALMLARDAAQIRCYVGIAVEPDETLPDGFVSFDLPEMALVSAWHGPDDDTAARYEAMTHWLRDGGYTHDTSVCLCREEYPHEPEGGVRLMIPVMRVFS